MRNLTPAVFVTKCSNNHRIKRHMKIEYTCTKMKNPFPVGFVIRNLMRKRIVKDMK